MNGYLAAYLDRVEPSRIHDVLSEAEGNPELMPSGSTFSQVAPGEAVTGVILIALGADAAIAGLSQGVSQDTFERIFWASVGESPYLSSSTLGELMGRLACRFDFMFPAWSWRSCWRLDLIKSPDHVRDLQ